MKNLFLFTFGLLFLSCNTSKKEQHYSSKNYNIYISGTLAGTYTSALDEKEFYNYTFKFNDRGRGPDIHEKIKLNDEGVIKSLEISGLSYFKDSVNETFNFSKGKAIWKSKSKKDSITTDGNSFYTSVNGTFGDTELLIRKLLSSPDHSVDLLPSGKVQITDIETIKITDSISLNLIEYSGLGLTPNYIWMDDENRMFASILPLFATFVIIEEKHKVFSEQLVEIQSKRQNNHFKKLAKKLTEIPTGKIIIKNVNIFDSKSGTILPHRSVVINGNKIEAILLDSKSLAKNAKIIDGTNKTLLPGLFDNHCHISRSDGILHIAAGVTSVRDMANSIKLLEIRKEFDNNISIGPRVVTMSGFIDKKGPYQGPVGKIVSSLEEGLSAIDYYKNNGYNQIKLYSSIEPEWVKPMAKKAHDLGLKLSGHIPAYMLAEDAIKDGYDEIQHINMLVLNFLPDTLDTRTPLRFTEVAEHAHELDLKSTKFKKFVKLLKDKDIEIDPTVSFFEGMFTAKQGEPDPTFSEILDRLPIQVSRRFYSSGLSLEEGKEQQHKDSFNKLLEIIYELYANGVTILPGTDSFVGFALYKELENYVRAGIPTSEVLKMATIISARANGVDKQLGSIEVGKLADLILVDGNPVENISNLRRNELTIKDGKIYNTKKLYESLSIKHYK